MKINSRLYLLTFILITSISVIYTFIYYSTTYSLLQKQHIKNLTSTSNTLKSLFDSQLNSVIAESPTIYNLLRERKIINLDKFKTDFVIEIDSSFLIKNIYSKEKYLIEIENFNEFKKKNPNAITWLYQDKGKSFVFGKMLEYDDLSERLLISNIFVSFVIDDNPIIDPKDINKNNNIMSILNYLKINVSDKKEVYSDPNSNNEFILSYIDINMGQLLPDKLGVIVYSNSEEIVSFKSTIIKIIIILILALTFLVMIFVYIFTAKLRRQLAILSKASEMASTNNYSYRAEVITKDEVGQLAGTFNNMLNEIERKNKLERSYIEYLAYVNESPELKDLCQRALRIISEQTVFNISKIEIKKFDNTYDSLATNGITGKFDRPIFNSDSINKVIENKEKIHTKYNDDRLTYKSITNAFILKEILIIPIIYNSEVIGLCELASEKFSNENDLLFVENITEQIAIGIVNQKNKSELELLVKELQEINDDYKLQNQKMLQQNRSLAELHDNLKIKAEELREQKNKAEELTKAKSEFLANISHDLKTPLSTIIGLTELINEATELPSEVRAKQSIILRNGKKLLYLINNILEFSKSETGKIENKKTQFYLNDFIYSIEDYVISVSNEKSINFDINLVDEKDFLIKVDQTLLEQVIINLLNNAFKYTADGDVILSVQVEATTLQVSVKDTGPGISKEDQDKLFNEYNRLTSKETGTGLGLTICKKYTEIMNGELFVFSEKGKGSEFKVVIPDVIVKEISLRKSRIAFISKNSEYFDIYSDYLSHKHVELQLFSDYNYQAKNFENIPALLDIEHPLSLELIWQNLNIINEHWLIPFFISNQTNHSFMLFIDGMILNGDIRKLIKQIFRIENIKIKQIKNILWLNENQEEFHILDRFNITIAKYINIITNTANENDLIIINVDNYSFSSLDILYDIKKSKVTRDIPVILNMVVNDAKMFLEKFKQKIINLAESKKYHINDTLNVVRQVFNLEVDEKIKNKLLYEETIEKEVTKNKQIVLIVDDDKDILYMINNIVQDMNYLTILAENGRECMNALTKTIPDLILMDIRMPIMDGFEAISEIRFNVKYREIPVIAMTAHAMLDNRETLEKSGFNKIITKPILLPEFRQTIIDILKKD